MSDLYIEQSTHFTEYAVIGPNGPVFYDIAGKNDGGLAYEQIYTAVVERLQPQTETVFIRITNKQKGYLPYKECLQIPKSGDLILVQLKRITTGEKLPYFTQDITLAGKYAVLLPFSKRYSVSARIRDEAQKKQLSALAALLAPEGMGLIIRAEAVDAAQEQLKEEIDGLYHQFLSIRRCAAACSAPSLLSEEKDPLDRIFRDQHDIDRVFTNLPFDHPGLTVTQLEHPIRDRNLRKLIGDSLKHRIFLKSGADITVDLCEAFTVYDVNSASCVGPKGSSKQGLIFKVNCEAAIAIAANIRLRRLGGIILIDFLDMASQEQRTQVLECFKNACARDPVKTVIYGFTKLGILQMTRKRTENILLLKEVEPLWQTGSYE